MNDGEQFASPVFKKRFARRQTTHRPFTFARSFEAAEPSASQVVKQVGDRGLVITSPVQLSSDNQALSITDIVRQSAVPVLIAHSSPKHKEKENTEQEEEEEESIGSQRRRSGRSRQPSDQFLSRLQHPHGTPKDASFHRSNDKHYIGSRNSSTIDTEVSFTQDGDSTKRSKKTTATTSTRSARHGNRSRTTHNTSTLDTSVSSRSRNVSTMETSLANRSHTTHNGSSLESTVASSVDHSGIDSSRALSKKKGSGRKLAAVATETSSGKRRRGQPVVDKTPSPLPSMAAAAKSSSTRLKKSAASSKAPPPLSRGKKNSVLSPLQLQENEEILLETSKTQSQEKKRKSPAASSVNSKKVKTPPLSSDVSDVDQSASGRSRRGQNKSVADTSNRSASTATGVLSQASSTAKKTTGVAAETNSSVSKRTRTPPVIAHGKGVKNTRVTRDTNGEPSTAQSSKKNNDNFPIQGRKRVTSGSTEDLGPTAGKTARRTPVQDTRNGSTQRVVNKAQSSPGSPSYQSRKGSTQKAVAKAQSSSPASPTRKGSTQRAVRKAQSSPVSPTRKGSTQRAVRTAQSSPASPSSQSARRRKRTTQATNNSHNASSSQSTRHTNSTSKATVSTRTLQKSNQSSRDLLTDPKSPEKCVRSETTAVRKSPQKGLSNSFWKTSRTASAKPKRSRRIASVSSDNDNDSCGDSVKESSALPQLTKRKVVSRPVHKPDRGDDSTKNGELKRQNKVVTEIAVINNMLCETEEDIVEGAGMTQTCGSVVHKVLSFTKKQLQQAETQLLEIADLTYQINKLKSECRSMSSDSKENTEQKVILQKELHSLEMDGVDVDMIRIDEWMQDFKALQQCSR